MRGIKYNFEEYGILSLEKNTISLFMKERIQLLKEIFLLLREAIIVLLFLFLLMFPTSFKNKLVELGFSRVEFMGMDMNLSEQIKETADAGKQVADLQLQASGLKSVIDSIQKKSTNPEEKKILKSLSNKTETMYSTANKLDGNIKQRMSVQQEALTEQTNIKAPDEGWIYAGKINQEQTTWLLSIKPTIAERKINYESGEELTITDDVYLRKDEVTTMRANSEVIAVIKAGEKVIFIEKDYSHAVGGGWFMWLKVRRNSKA
jgi:hypothetical protein